MSDYSYDQNWQRTKEYLIRSLFTDTSALSPIPEESVESSTPVTEESDNLSVFDDSSNSSSRSDSPVPPLIIEMEPNRHDDPPEYYKQLHARMLRLYRKLFIERCERVSSIDFADSQDEDSNNNEEATVQEFTESIDAVHSKDLDDTVGEYEVENNEEITSQQVIEAHDSTSGNDYNDSQSLKENINQEETVTQQTIEERGSTSHSDHDGTQTINNEDTTPLQLIEGDSLESGNDYDVIHHNSDHSLTGNINDEEKITKQIFEDNSESTNDYEDELEFIDNNYADDLIEAVTQEEYNVRSPILQSFGLRTSRHAVLEDNEGSTTEFFVQGPDERASSNISITERELEIMRGATERHQSFGLLRAISSSSIGEIEDPKSIENMESSIDSTRKTHPRKRQSEDNVTATPTKIVKYGNQQTQTTIEDSWDSYFRLNFFEGTPKIFKLCSCRNLCDC